MTKGIFITATGTDVGKTYISALILKKILKLGINAGYYKPALSGAVRVNGELVPGDCDYVLKTAGLNKNPKDFVSYIFEQAVSPHLAAKINNIPIKLSKIQEDFKKLTEKYDYILVEGAGGLVCPFNLCNEKLLLPDVIKALGLDIIIVASADLGTLNSISLTVDYAKNHGINICGIILNNYDENNYMQRDNLIQAENLTGIPVIAAVKHGQKEIEISPEIFKEI